MTANRHATCSLVPEGFSSVTEGKATILHEGNDVFYNKAQVVNRDISIAVLRWFSGLDSKGSSKKAKKAGPIGMGKLPTGTPFKVSMVAQGYPKPCQRAHITAPA